MLTLRPLRRDDVVMLQEKAEGDMVGAARLGMPPDRWWRIVDGDPDRHGWIVLDGDEPVGYLDADHQAGTVAVAALIFGEHRGSGLGSALVRAALDALELLGATDVVACVEPDNEPARRLLREAGFVEDGIDDDGLVVHRFVLGHGPPARTS